MSGYTSTNRSGNSRAEWPVDRRVIGVGLLAGAAVGAWAGGKVRSFASR